jgi:hypothetical protein
MQYISGINYPVLMFIIGLLVLDGGTKIMGGCTTFSGVALGTLVGFVLGIVWFVLFYSTGNVKIYYSLMLKLQTMLFALDPNSKHLSVDYTRMVSLLERIKYSYTIFCFILINIYFILINIYFYIFVIYYMSK